MPPKLTTEQRLALLDAAPTVEDTNYDAKKSKHTLAADKSYWRSMNDFHELCQLPGGKTEF